MSQRAAAHAQVTKRQCEDLGVHARQLRKRVTCESVARLFCFATMSSLASRGLDLFARHGRESVARVFGLADPRGGLLLFTARCGDLSRGSFKRAAQRLRVQALARTGIFARDT